MSAEQGDFVPKHVVSTPRSISGLDTNTAPLNGNDVASTRWNMLSERDRAILTAARKQKVTLRDLVDEFGTTKQNISMMIHRRKSFLSGGEKGKPRRRFSQEVLDAHRSQKNSLASSK